VKVKTGPGRAAKARLRSEKARPEKTEGQSRKLKPEEKQERKVGYPNGGKAAEEGVNKAGAYQGRTEKAVLLVE
jgi:hypothetical protein